MPTNASSLALTPNLIVYTETTGAGMGQIVAVHRDGTQPRVLAQARYLGRIVVDTQYVYYTSADGDSGYISSIYRAPL